MRGWVVCVLAACGGGTSPAPQRTGPAATTVAPAAGPDDVIVAQVNGRPVWGSCVAAQASRGIARDAALRECVDFELLAQAAEARGLATAPEVTEGTRGALANRLVETGFEATYRSPADVPGQIDRVIAANPLLANRPERRGSTYARFETCGRLTCIKCRPGDQLLRAHPLLELALQRCDVLPQRRAAQHVEQARDREQRIALAPRDRDAGVGLLDEACRGTPADDDALDLEPDRAQVGEVAAYGPLARVDEPGDLGERPATLEPTQLVEHAQRASGVTQIPAAIQGISVYCA